MAHNIYIDKRTYVLRDKRIQQQQQKKVCIDIYLFSLTDIQCDKNNRQKKMKRKMSVLCDTSRIKRYA